MLTNFINIASSVVRALLIVKEHFGYNYFSIKSTKYWTFVMVLFLDLPIRLC